jgi:hypothetical protein
MFYCLHCYGHKILIILGKGEEKDRRPTYCVSHKTVDILWLDILTALLILQSSDVQRLFVWQFNVKVSKLSLNYSSRYSTYDFDL